MYSHLELYTLFLFLLYYHISEPLLVSILTPEELTVSSFLITPQYVLFMLLGLVEYTFTLYFFPLYKLHTRFYFYISGLILTMIGDCIRKSAWITAKHAFTHLIKTTKRSNHQLVTHGIYSWSRHPGYVGWLWWSIGTQLMLGNGFSCVVFACVAWRFFVKRIPYEEYFMYQMFGEEFIRYKSRVPTRIPFVD
mmetsp:Transcript_12080/g.21852  ORF Transcript_12080/g.21852 Transcript_12080/m.21852 type:complete len:193 (-) Transcript_12080:497-1075(-)